jgi:hypothetical protein
MFEITTIPRVSSAFFVIAKMMMRSTDILRSR